MITQPKTRQKNESEVMNDENNQSDDTNEQDTTDTIQ